MKLLISLVVYTLSFPVFCYSELLDRVVASVDGSPISESEIVSELKKINASQSIKLPISKENMKSALTSILLQKEAERLGISVSQDELDLQLKDVITRSQISKEEFEQTLLSNGISLMQYREKLASELNRSRVITTVLKSRVQVSQEELSQYVGEDVTTELTEDRFSLLKFIIKTKEFDYQAEELKIKLYIEKDGQCEKYSSDIISSCQSLGVVKVIDLKESYSELLQDVDFYRLTKSIPENESNIVLMKVSSDLDSKQSATKLGVKDKLVQDKFRVEAEKYLDKELFEKYTVEMH